LENNEKTNHANLSFGFNLDVDIMLCLIPDSIHQLNGRAGTTRATLKVVWLARRRKWAGSFS
jgi:hypothetical protein